MANQTTNYSFTKPLDTEYYDVGVQNDNWDKVDSEIAKKVNTADIVNNVTSSDATKPLSANQGKVLQRNIDSVNSSKVSASNGNISNTIVSEVTQYNDSALSFLSGEKTSSIFGKIKASLNYLKNTKVNISAIVDNLASTSTTQPLSANQGSVLNSKINATTNYVGVAIVWNGSGVGDHVGSAYRQNKILHINGAFNAKSAGSAQEILSVSGVSAVFDTYFSGSSNDGTGCRGYIKGSSIYIDIPTANILYYFNFTCVVG